MKSRLTRLQAIKRIITQYEVASQYDLIEHLSNEGFRLTQATLSRDLKALRVAKVPTPTGYVYSLAESGVYIRTKGAENNTPYAIHKTGFLSIEFSGNLGVIKTLTGFASALAYEIDQHSLPHIISTLAGDNTLLLILREGYTAEETINALKNIFDQERDK